MADLEKAPERKRRDWIIILIILLIGFICVILAGGRAIRFSPTWKMDTDMGSNIDPNSAFLTSRPSGFLEPLDPSILTQPVWINVFLTPGASFLTGTPVTSLPTNTPLVTNTFIPTAIISPTNTGVPPSPTNTLIYFPPFTNTPKPPANTPIPTFTNTPIPFVDLAITKDDSVSSYSAGSTVIYTIVINNNGPADVTGAIVTDNKPAQVVTWDWVCTLQSGGASGCDAVTGSGFDFSDTVDLPNGASITYTVTANISVYAVGTLTNSAAIAIPVGYTETNPSDNNATDSDTYAGGGPDINIGGPDGDSDNPGRNGSFTIVFEPGIYANGDVGIYDFVYYEIESSPGSGTVEMDWVMIEISADGSPGSWIPVLVWGNATSDTNTNIDLALVGGFCAGGVEEDNCRIPSADLYPYPGTGVTIDIDSIPGITTGTSYPWMQISGIGGADGPNIDAIQPYYP